MIKIAVVKNSGLARSRTISIKKTTHENFSPNPFLDFPIKRLRCKSRLDFLTEIHLEDGFVEAETVFGYRFRLQNPKSEFQDLNPDSPIEHILCQTRGRLFKVPYFR